MSRKSLGVINEKGNILKIIVSISVGKKICVCSTKDYQLIPVSLIFSLLFKKRVALGLRRGSVPGETVAKQRC